MRVLGLDVATITGWAVIDRPDGEREQLVAYSAEVLDGEDTAGSRITSFAHRIYAEATLRPDLVAIELPYHNKNAHTTITLARFVGRFEQAFYDRQIVLFPAGEWQHHILGVCATATRTQRKAEAVAWAWQTYRKRMTHDEADACGIARWGLQRARIGRGAAR